MSCFPDGTPLPSPLGNELRKAEAEYLALVHKNVEIERACDRLEAAIHGGAHAAAAGGEDHEAQ